MSRDGMIMMYGAPPVDPWPTPIDRTPVVPVVPFAPSFQPYIGAIGPVVPLAPPTKDSVVRDLVMRIDWLRAQLANAEAWREELATLERMMAATTLEPTATPAPGAAGEKR